MQSFGLFFGPGLLGSVLVCQFGKSLPLVGKLQPSRLSFDMPSIAGQSRAFFGPVAVLVGIIGKHSASNYSAELTRGAINYG